MWLNEWVTDWGKILSGFSCHCFDLMNEKFYNGPVCIHLQQGTHSHPIIILQQYKKKKHTHIEPTLPHSTHQPKIQWSNKTNKNL